MEPSGGRVLQAEGTTRVRAQVGASSAFWELQGDWLEHSEQWGEEWEVRLERDQSGALVALVGSLNFNLKQKPWEDL